MAVQWLGMGNGIAVHPDCRVSHEPREVLTDRNSRAPH